ncbi:hypothetical protein PAPYR_5832 [Paratrimastix pyriformis]|uniref:Uncharacterized protein n=1 Tax=Paratrimastix pyriformis TaxID=342808 RepID=A0ABQ8UGR2_9EUKA|nr:hypothetical protein PAPYR_5832 [Paratrimastix pyriformis]
MEQTEMEPLLYRSKNPIANEALVARALGFTDEPRTVFNAEHWDQEGQQERDFQAVFQQDADTLREEFNRRGHLIFIKNIRQPAYDSVSWLILALMSIYQRPNIQVEGEEEDDQPKWAVVLEGWQFPFVGVALEDKDVKFDVPLLPENAESTPAKPAAAAAKPAAISLEMADLSSFATALKKKDH